MVASPQATGNGVEQGAGTPQIQALSVQSLSSSIVDLGPRKGFLFSVMLSSENSVITERLGRSSIAEKSEAFFEGNAGD